MGESTGKRFSMQQFGAREASQRVPTLKTLPPRCQDCAFTVGTEANSSERTRLTAELCIESLEPFYCHIRTGVFCMGWAERVVANSDEGKYAEEGKWRRDLASNFLDVLGDSEKWAEAKSEQEVLKIILDAIERRQP